MHVHSAARSRRGNRHRGPTSCGSTRCLLLRHSQWGLLWAVLKREVGCGLSPGRLAAWVMCSLHLVQAQPAEAHTSYKAAACGSELA
jgi:hypothetical protein